MSQTAIFYHSDAIETEGTELVGRRAAGQSFLRGYLDHMPGDQLRAVTQTKQAADEFNTVARKLGESREICVHSLRGGRDFSEAGTIFFPGPGYLDAAWQREAFGASKCSLVGITHTMSTRRVIEGVNRLMSEPVRPWDAIICTSNAVRSVLETQIEDTVDYLTRRFGARQVPVPQLPVIPLGVHADDFAPLPGYREALREKFEVPEDAVVVLTMGRLTSVEKANPVPLFMALEKIAQRQGAEVHLWMTGWASREAEKTLHLSGAKALCPSVKVSFIDGNDAEVRRHIWAGADVFTLPVDNIQETFGLAPVEAMAAGLPVVMPDWNGFRDTVVDGETGLLVRTVTQNAGQPAGRLAARRFADGTDGYLQHLSILQQQTAIDVGAYTEALELLIKDKIQRQIMGEAGQKHVRATFDWSKVIPRYAELADELEAMRTAQDAPPAKRPMQIDPFHLYRAYPSKVINGDWSVKRKRRLPAETLAALDKLNGRQLYRRRVLPDADLLTIAEAISGETTLSELAAQTKHRLDVVQSAVLFLAKYDFVVLKEPN